MDFHIQPGFLHRGAHPFEPFENRFPGILIHIPHDMRSGDNFPVTQCMQSTNQLEGRLNIGCPVINTRYQVRVHIGLQQADRFFIAFRCRL